jgi:hypothetical protein
VSVIGRLLKWNRLNHERQNQDSLLVVTELPAALFLASRKNDEIFSRFFERNTRAEICRARWKGL